ncbi:MAG: DsbA family protein [Acidobacteriota bacterium]|nr:DsbA family protein [Acidobacteriota bacterium]
MTVDVNAVSACLANRTYQTSLDRDERLAIDLGINGMPTTSLDGRQIAVRPVEDLRSAMQSELKATRFGGSLQQ